MLLVALSEQKSLLNFTEKTKKLFLSKTINFTKELKENEEEKYHENMKNFLIGMARKKIETSR